MWHLSTALGFLSEVRAAVLSAGYEVGLTGSVLHRGKSAKDIDIIIYPLNTEKQNVEALERALTGMGLVKEFDKDFVQKMWREKANSKDQKHVEVWRDSRDRRRRRIDIFLLK